MKTLHKLHLINTGAYYRMGDMLVKYKNGYWIISRRFDKGIDLINSASHGQRRTQPVKYDGILSLFNAMCDCNENDMKHFDLRDGQHMKVRLV